MRIKSSCERGKSKKKYFKNISTVKYSPSKLSLVSFDEKNVMNRFLDHKRHFSAFMPLVRARDQLLETVENRIQMHFELSVEFIAASLK